MWIYWLLRQFINGHGTLASVSRIPQGHTYLAQTPPIEVCCMRSRSGRCWCYWTGWARRWMFHLSTAQSQFTRRVGSTGAQIISPPYSSCVIHLHLFTPNSLPSMPTSSSSQRTGGSATQNYPLDGHTSLKKNIIKHSSKTIPINQSMALSFAIWKSAHFLYRSTHVGWSMMPWFAWLSIACRAITLLGRSLCYSDSIVS